MYQFYRVTIINPALESKTSISLTLISVFFKTVGTHSTNFYAASFISLSDTEFTADISFKTIATLHYVSDYGSNFEIARDIDMDSMNSRGVTCRRAFPYSTQEK